MNDFISDVMDSKGSFSSTSVDGEEAYLRCVQSAEKETPESKQWVTNCPRILARVVAGGTVRAFSTSVGSVSRLISPRDSSNGKMPRPGRMSW